MQPTDYVTVGQLATILNWSRTATWWWLERLRPAVVPMGAGHLRFVRAQDVPELVARLVAARQAAYDDRQPGGAE